MIKMKNIFLTYLLIGTFGGLVIEIINQMNGNVVGVGVIVYITFMICYLNLPKSKDRIIK